MRKFLTKCLIALVLGTVTLFVSLTFLIAIEQKDVARVFTIPEGTKILCIGSSHTGCTWQEGNGVYSLWTNAAPFIFSLMRLQELERREMLNGIQYCIIDTDYETLLNRMQDSYVETVYLQTLPFSWRYFMEIPGYKNKFNCFLGSLTWQGHLRVCKSKLPTDGDSSRILFKQREVLSKRNFQVSNERYRFCMLKNQEVARKIKELCDRHNIKLIFFSSPLISFHPLRNDHKFHSDWIDFLKRSDIEFWDLRAVCEDADFRDVDHLNSFGRERLPRRCFTPLFK